MLRRFISIVHYNDIDSPKPFRRFFDTGVDYRFGIQPTDAVDLLWDGIAYGG